MRRDHRAVRWLLIALLCAGITGTLGVYRLAGASESTVPGNFDPYLHRTTGDLADPVNLVFRGTLDQAAAFVGSVLGWKAVEGSEMVFYDHGAHLSTAKQFGFDLGNGSRYHIRLEAVQSDGGETYVLSGVHRDDSVACGHVGRGFNVARDLVASTFQAAGFEVTSLHLQNTSPGRQCDGSMTFGDGTAALIDLTGGRHDLSEAHAKSRRLVLPFGLSIPLPHWHLL